MSENAAVSNKARKKIEEKININIFLGQNDLDLGSDSEIGIRQPTIIGRLVKNGLILFKKLLVYEKKLIYSKMIVFFFENGKL